MSKLDKRLQARKTANKRPESRYWNIRNVGNKTAELTIYGQIGESIWEESIGAKAIKDELDAFGDLSAIDAYINSPGGSVPEGLAIYNDLRRREVQTDVTVTGFASSIASIIAMAAAPGRLFMGEGAMMMIHDPLTWTVGNAEDHRKTADVLDKVGTSLVDIYESRTGLPREEIEDMMASETWFTADDAVEQGFADAVAEPVEAQIAASSISFNPAAFGSLDKMAAAKTAPTKTEFFDALAQRMFETIETPAQGATTLEVADMTEEVTNTPAPQDSTSGQVIDLAQIKAMIGDAVKEVVTDTTKEQQRVTALGELFESFPDLNELHAKAITDKLTIGQAKEAIFDHMNGEKTSEIKPDGLFYGGGHIGAGEQDAGKAMIEGMSQSVMARAAADKIKREPTNEYNGYNLLDLARICVARTGERVPNDRSKMVAMAFTHSRSDYPLLLEDAINKSLLMGWEEQPETWQTWCGRMTLNDYRSHPLPRLESFANMKLVEAGAEYEYGTIGEFGESIIAQKWGRMISIDEETIVNDDLNAMSAIPRRMGRAAARVPGNLAYGILTANGNMSDGNPLFDAAHNNVGTPGALSDTTVAEMELLMSTQTDATVDAEGNNDGAVALNINPQYLIVPRALRLTAQQLMNSQFELGAANQVPNTVQGMMTVVADARLDVTSAIAYYAAASGTMGDTVRVGFLDGIDVPQVRAQDGFKVDGIEYKVRIVVGASPVDWRGLVYNAGA